MKKVTAKEIAKQVGVSQATVSLVFHNKPGVSDEIRNKVLQTAEAMGYAAEPRHGGNRLMQMVVYKRHGRVISDNPFIEILIQGVAAQAAKLGYHLSVSYFYGDKDRKEQIKGICSLQSDGMILLSTEMEESDFALFRDITVPIVLLDNFSWDMNWDAVGIDNQRGVRNAIRYLIQCGHTRIGYLHSNVDIRNFRERQTGYMIGCKHLKEAMARDASKRIVNVNVDTEHAASSMKEYLAANPFLPSAFFADNDHIAAGCCRALVAAGYRIPEDVSVIGFDDAPISVVAEPQLTTMAVPKERMGALAVSRLAERIQDPSLETIHIKVMPELVVRDSVLDLNDWS